MLVLTKMCLSTCTFGWYQQNPLMPNGLGLQSYNMLILAILLIQDLNEYELTKYVDINILRILKGNNPFSIVPIASISTSSRWK